MSPLARLAATIPFFFAATADVHAGAAKGAELSRLAARYQNHHSDAFCYPGRAQGFKVESVNARSTPRGDWLILTERFQNGSAQTVMVLVSALSRDAKVEAAKCDAGRSARLTLRCDAPCIISFNPNDKVSRMMALGRLSRKLVHPGRTYLAFDSLRHAETAAATIRALVDHPNSRTL